MLSSLHEPLRAFPTRGFFWRYKLLNGLTMPYTLITGVTGLLGQYLLRDLLRQDRPVAVLVRSTPLADAHARVEGILSAWESRLGRCLPRPQVLDGDLTKPGLGLNHEDSQFLRTSCDAVLHNAASLVFHGSSRDGEPYRTNVAGTRNLVEAAQKAGIRDFHHVSTAYVCGQRHGVVPETDADPQADFGNDYERSKAEAETIVRQAFGHRATIYRPSVIIGDSQTAFTSTYRGFYTAVQISWLIARTSGATASRDFIHNLGFGADDCKNLVPVDWVSQAISGIMQDSTQVGNVFHITNPELTPTATIEEAICTAIAQTQPAVGQVASSVKRVTLSSIGFESGMDVYRSYFRTDPLFDSRNTESVLAGCPCPIVDRSMLIKLCRWAMDAKFATLPPRSTGNPAPIAAVMRSSLPRAKTVSPAAETLRIKLTGPGGGLWTVVFESGRLAWANSGFHESTNSLLYGPASAFWTLVANGDSCDEYLAEGALVLEGDSQSRSRVKAVIEQLRGTSAGIRRAS